MLLSIELRRRMSTVNLYGTGINAAKFLMACSSEVEVGMVIEGREEKIKLSPEFFGYKVAFLEDVIEKMKCSYTVVAASEYAFLEIKRRLEAFGLIEFEHFEYFSTYKKKVAIVYGNCHTDSIKDTLCKSRGFSEKYGIYPMPPVQEIKRMKIDIKSIPLESADVFIHQCIWEKNFYGIEFSSSSLIKRLHPNCRIIGIPNLYRMPKFLFPQIPEEFDQKYYKEFGSL